jgi:hypothetical protein
MARAATYRTARGDANVVAAKSKRHGIRMIPTAPHVIIRASG